jgi:hypothetical protein
MAKGLGYGASFSAQRMKGAPTRPARGHKSGRRCRYPAQ